MAKVCTMEPLLNIKLPIGGCQSEVITMLFKEMSANSSSELYLELFCSIH
jgi:hypothetical protein